MKSRRPPTPPGSRQKGLGRVVKRSLDIWGAVVGLIASSPVLGATAAGIWLTMGRPIFFRQLRPGLGARPFVILKLRTMRDAVDAMGRPLPDADRLTTVGKIARKLSIDELPQLLNVLRGEMSLVGPRPLLTQYLPRYSLRQARRHEVVPGITGWAQVNGRNALTHEERFELDVWYVENWSLSLDLKILATTVMRVLERKGVNAQGEATMPEFLGGSLDGGSLDGGGGDT